MLLSTNFIKAGACKYTRLLCVLCNVEPVLVTQRVLWCLRSYKPFVVAQVAGKPMEEAEALLRAYLGGANERRQRLDLTTPLWRNSEGAVFFALPGLQVCACLVTCMIRVRVRVKGQRAPAALT